VSRRGFTLLEMVIASALAGVVLLAGFGVLGFIRSADRQLSTRFEEANELGILHETVRRALQTLVAAPEPTVVSAAAPEPADPREAEAEKERKKANEDAQKEFSGTAYEAPEHEPPRFLLEPQIGGRVAEGDPRRLEVVLLDQPAPGPARISPTVRGAFELRPELKAFALIWAPINPPGEPVKLAGDIAQLRWSALSRDPVANRYEAKSGAWRDDMAALHPKDYPKAIRLQIVTASGREVDWLFEPAITTGPEP
jgi:prepilin-type N-terminal cleavage/methylation domain-containing protein